MPATLTVTDAQTRAQKRADQMAAKYGHDFYVVLDGGRFWVASRDDMDTFYAGLSPVYCASDGPSQ